ncbi:MAG: hypothetical protein R3280_14840 [Marinobacter sp.]|uniref:hypothetical protein n=1 Tax=Marinobacter sp. TaxID=50741 RepID=UPI00299DD396|nr:hypothetical protein [Marinobacter sp.]MDX1635913.1 hypothetical protein [Marinobacter sp.]
MPAALASFCLALACGLQAYPAQGSGPGQTFGQQSYESCSLITSEYVTVLQLIHRGFSRPALTEALPGISEPARQRVTALYDTVEDQGLAQTWGAVNSEYVRCATAVHDRVGQPPRISREGHFHFCAGENKVRYQVLRAAMQGASAGDILPQLNPIHRPTAKALLTLYGEDGALAVYSALADELKHCINNNL